MASPTLDSIKKNNLIFISAQPDEPYFHWQVELYLYNFSNHGIEDNSYALFSYKDKPSDAALKLATRFKHIHFYKDTRIHGGKNHYEPSIRPHILKQFFSDFPHLGANVFYHDSDIIFVSLPKFELMLEDDVAYLSDTISYNGSVHLKEVSSRHKAKYNVLAENDLFKKMCECLEISEELVSSNELNTGGAQYLLKKLDAEFWIKVEKDCVKLHELVSEYSDKYKIENPAQKWCADMWSVLWGYWRRGSKTLISKELSFSWAISTSLEYYTNNIFHYAGVDGKNDADKFGKFNYKSKCPFKSYLFCHGEFEHIPPTQATHEFCKYIKEYANTLIFENILQLSIKNKEEWASTYTQDDTVLVCKTPIYRSDCKKYLIFNNNSSWGLTFSVYEDELKEGSGSLLSDPDLAGAWAGSTVEVLKSEAIKKAKEIDRFVLVSKQAGFSNIYAKDVSKIICGRAVWRSSDKKYLIFYNKNKWTLTDVIYEGELKEGSGGFLFGTGKYAYSNWEDCNVTLL